MTATACPQAEKVPLCVDLDGTLVKCDTLQDLVCKVLRTDPSVLFSFPKWLSKGKACFKEELSRRATLDSARLPYNEELLEFLKSEHAAGRRIFLVTGAHYSVAESVAHDVGIFERVWSTDGSNNLTGANKSAILQEHFGETGFSYIGNSVADLPALHDSEEPILANPTRKLRKHLSLGKIKPVRIFWARRSVARSVLQAIRVRQWCKNLLVFAPLALAHRFHSLTTILGVFLAFLSFSLAASATYVLNDLLDLEADRGHPQKRTRPFAAGELTPLFGAALIPFLLICAFGLATLLPGRYLPWLAIYILTTVAYSFWLKRVAIIDVIVLAGLYSLRLAAGSEAGYAPLSPWLVAFSIFLFLSLATVKRYSELHNIRRSRKVTTNGRGYRVEDIEQIRSFGTASAYCSAVVLALYINHPQVTQLYVHPQRLWLLLPLSIFWTSRIWLLAHRGDLKEDPVVYAVTNPESLLIGVLAIGIVMAGAL
jgi:4-hydroxybenzoate polyprenyltransferase